MDVCLQQHRHGLYLAAMIDLVTFKCNIWSQMKQRIVINMDVACLGCMVDFFLQSGKSNTAHLLCIRMSQYTPLPILETHITPLHVLNILHYMSHLRVEHTDQSWLMTTQPECAVWVQLCSADVFLTFHHWCWGCKMTVIRWDSSEPVLGLTSCCSLCSTHLFTCKLALLVTGKDWLEARTWVLFFNRLIGSKWNFYFYFFFKFVYHTLQTNGIASVWYMFFFLLWTK